MRRSASDAAATRRSILAAGLELVAERGYRAARLADVAARAGVTRGAVYHHFADKGALLETALREGWQEAMAPVLEPLQREREPLAAIRGFLDAFLRAIEEDPAVHRLIAASLVVDLPRTGARDKTRSLTALREALAARMHAAGFPRERARSRASVLLDALLGRAALAGLPEPSPADREERLRALMEIAAP